MENKNSYYLYSEDETIKSLNTSLEGISNEEAKTRLAFYGENKLTATSKRSLLLTFLAQVKNLMVVILIISATFSLYLHEYRDASIIYVIVFINAMIGFMQEYKAEKIMSSLKSMIKSKAKVIRNGETIEIDGEMLAPGDLVYIEAGDMVPADLRIISENDLGTNDFALTGESNPTQKFTHAIGGEVPLADRNNLVYMGTTVATGNAKGIVVATGMNTEIGRIAQISQEVVPEASPLQKEITVLAQKITIIACAIALIFSGIGLALSFSVTEAIIFGLGLAVSSVPEGLPAQISIALSLAAGRLAKENAIVKKLSAVETLGATHIICTDKTGTLTKNEMTVERIVIAQNNYLVSGTGYIPEGQILNPDQSATDAEFLKQNHLFFETGLLASNAQIKEPDADHPIWHAIGDPTEAALVTLALKGGVALAVNDDYKELREFTFDSVRRRMSSIRQFGQELIVYVKGSPENVLESCTHYLENGEIKAIDDDFRKFIKSKDDENASQALRNLAFAYKKISTLQEADSMESSESNLIWLGLVSMSDPLREDVIEAIKATSEAKIRVIIITGDYPLTAAAIGKKLGFVSDGNLVTLKIVTGQELRQISDLELLRLLINTNLIFARTSPEDKLRIVTLLKKAGEVVAVTGDGVNDAPALKKADIGVAMGLVGTEVAKDSAEIILLDDSFSTLVTAIREGRSIFDNLKKTIFSSLTSNCAELGVIVMSLIGNVFFDIPFAILVVQILAIDLIGEMLPLTFLTWDPPQEETMKQLPRNPNEHILSKSKFFDVFAYGLLMGGLGYLNYLWFISNHGISSLHYMQATTITYLTIVIIQWINILSRRCYNNESIFSRYLFSNKMLLLGYGISVIFLLNIVYNPFISKYLSTAAIGLEDWAAVALAAIFYLLVTEMVKLYKRKKTGNSLVK